MKMPESQISTAGIFNVFSLGAISLTWGHILGLISPWFIPLTILMYCVGYASEVKINKK
jgi:hypothetical protein